MDFHNLIVIGSMLFSALLINGILLGIIFSVQRSAAKAANWSSTLGTVTYSGIEWRRGSKGSSVAYPVVRYTYQFMGNSYEGNAIAPGPRVGGTGARKVVERYPVGAQVMVYYDPNNPSDAVLERSMPGYVPVLWAVIVLVDLFLCGMAILLAFIL
ncbi:MAG: DUF3592 domain-containing protein [Chloroflexota bacterium]|jgi:hypothetical protein